MQKNIDIIKKISAVDLVFNKMKELILTGEWEINKKIPAENELAKSFNVNRLTVRLAIQRLNTIGILDTRQGEGTYVKKFQFKDYIDQIIDFNTYEDMMKDVLIYRKFFEPGYTFLAMKNGTDIEKQQLKKLLDELAICEENATQDPSEDNIEKLADADINFHYHICKMSHNMIFLRSFILIWDVLYEYLKNIAKVRIYQKIEKLKSNNKSSRQIFSHSELYDCIIKKDYKRCEKAYFDLINYERLAY